VFLKSVTASKVLKLLTSSITSDPVTILDPLCVPMNVTVFVLYVNTFQLKLLLSTICLQLLEIGLPNF
jgi:hypothetical protein